MSGSIGKLYTFSGHSYGNRIRAAAAVGGVKLEFAEAEYKHGETNKTPEYLAKFPAGKIPAFEGKDGFVLFESSAIARYVATQAPKSGLLGTSPKDAALVDQWLAFSDIEIDTFRKSLNALLSGAVPYFKPMDLLAREKIYRNLDIIEKHLSTRTFLVGHRITLADITVASTLQMIFKQTAGPAERAKLPNLVRFFETISNQPAIKPIFGETVYADKASAYVAPAKPTKEKAPAAPAAPKEKAAPKPKPAADDDDDDEPAAAEEPKAKNPLELLPKSTLNLEDWKRAYSNLDTRGAGGSLEWFYEKNDPEGYSLWSVKYKYPEELTQVFMSSNLIGGFFNRLEASRKYLFGSMGVLGTNNDSLIEGVLIARGQDITPVVDVAPDFESYTYAKLDLKNPADKTFFEGALAWDLESGGKKWADGKNFK